MYTRASVLAAACLLLTLANPTFASDGVLEINQTCAIQTGCFPGDLPGFPVRLSEAGSYRLTSNLVVTNAVTRGIEILSSDTTLDLSGYGVEAGGPDGSTNGVFISSGAGNVEIRAGTIRGFPESAVWVSSGVTNISIIDIRAIGSGSTGLLIQGEGSLVRGCIVADGGGVGIRGFPGSLLLENVVYGNASFGMTLNSVAYGGNILYGNNASGVQVNESFGIQISGNQCGNAACP